MLLTPGQKAGVGGCAADQVADVPELVRVVDRPVQDVLIVGVIAGLGLLDGLGHRRQELVVEPACATTRVAAVQSWPALK